MALTVAVALGCLLLGFVASRVIRQSHSEFPVVQTPRRVIVDRAVETPLPNTTIESPFDTSIGVHPSSQGPVPTVIPGGDGAHTYVVGTTGSGKTLLVLQQLVKMISHSVQVVVLDPVKQGSDFEPIEHCSSVVWGDENIANTLGQLSEIWNVRTEWRKNNQISGPWLESYGSFIEVCLEESSLIWDGTIPARFLPILDNIARLGRSVGFHLTLLSQKGTLDFVSPMVRANLSNRILMATPDSTAVSVVIGDIGTRSSDPRWDPRKWDVKDRYYLAVRSNNTFPVLGRSWSIDLDRLREVAAELSLPTRTGPDAHIPFMLPFEEPVTAMTKCLGYLRENRAVSSTDLQTLSGYGKSVVVHLLHLMLDRGLIEKVTGGYQLTESGLWELKRIRSLPESSISDREESGENEGVVGEDEVGEDSDGEYEEDQVEEVVTTSSTPSSERSPTSEIESSVHYRFVAIRPELGKAAPLIVKALWPNLTLSASKIQRWISENEEPISQKAVDSSLKKMLALNVVVNPTRGSWRLRGTTNQ